MTNNDIRNEWEKHFGDSMPENELNEAFAKVMSSADRCNDACRTSTEDTQNSIDLHLCSGNAHFRSVDYIEAERPYHC